MARDSCVVSGAWSVCAGQLEVSVSVDCVARLVIELRSVRQLIQVTRGGLVSGLYVPAVQVRELLEQLESHVANAMKEVEDA